MKLFALAAAAAAVLCAQAPVQSPITKLPPDTVVATSDGIPITAGEIRGILESGDPQAIGLARNNPEQFLGSLFVMRYLAAEAEKQHLAEQSPLKEQLKYILDRLMEGAAINQLREAYSVPEEAINDFYAHNKSRYEFARIKVIAIGFCPTIPKNLGTSDEEIAAAAKAAVAASGCTNKHTEEQAHDMAVGIVGRIRGGADFVKLVEQHSEDPDSKATEGDFGLVTRDGAFKQEIKDAVFALKDGEVSNPIRSGNYFYIIKIKEKAVQPLSNVHEAIIQELKQKHFTDYMSELEKRFKPVITRPDFFTRQ
jgi:peptidyl-prolyl cis-trans isomerase C